MSGLSLTTPEIKRARARVISPPPEPTTNAQHQAAQCARIKNLLKQEDAVLITHYYTDPILQALSEKSGGFVGDSLEMARFGQRHSASTLVVCGVRFMGETAKILSPDKRIIMPDLEANCSLDIGCPATAFRAFCDAHPNRTVVVYANTSAAVKACADWVVTSSIALPIIAHLDAAGEAIVWAPDKHLGHYISKETGVDMVLWQGSCIVHDTFKANALAALKKDYPNAQVLVHPESPADVINMADIVGSTSQLLKASQESASAQFIVATERGIFYKMRQLSPHKTFIQAPSGGNGATCRSCIHCPWMAMNTLDRLESSLHQGSGVIEIDPVIIDKALLPLARMMNFAEKQKVSLKSRV